MGSFESAFLYTFLFCIQFLVTPYLALVIQCCMGWVHIKKTNNETRWRNLPSSYCQMLLGFSLFAFQSSFIQFICIRVNMLISFSFVVHCIRFFILLLVLWDVLLHYIIWSSIPGPLQVLRRIIAHFFCVISHFACQSEVNQIRFCPKCTMSHIEKPATAGCT